MLYVLYNITIRYERFKPLDNHSWTLNRTHGVTDTNPSWRTDQPADSIPKSAATNRTTRTKIGRTQCHHSRTLRILL